MRGRHSFPEMLSTDCAMIVQTDNASYLNCVSVISFQILQIIVGYNNGNSNNKMKLCISSITSRTERN